MYECFPGPFLFTDIYSQIVDPTIIFKQFHMSALSVAILKPES